MKARRILLAVAIVVAVPLAVVLAIASTRPDAFRVERSIDIQAPPEKVFAIVHDFRKFTAWSPYEKKDPQMQRSFSGPPAGKGAVYAWNGDGNVGEGRMEITDEAAPARVGVQLDFKRPFEARNRVTFSMNGQGGGTRMTWAMDGPMLFVSKVMSVFFDFDRMIGRDFEEGLVNLKALAEKPAS